MDIQTSICADVEDNYDRYTNIDVVNFQFRFVVYLNIIHIIASSCS